MKKVAFFVLVMIPAATNVIGQTLTGLVSEIITEYQENTADPESWVPENREVFSYNTRGQQTASLSMTWDHVQKDWKIVSDSYFEYDQAGNQTRIFSRNYMEYPDEVSSTHETRYYYAYDWFDLSNFKQTGYTITDRDYETGIKSVYETKCDQDTVTHFSSCRYYDFFSDHDSFTENIQVVNEQSDHLGRLQWTSTWITEKVDQVSQEYYDSTVYHYDGPSREIPIQKDYYKKNAYESYHLVRQEKQEFIYDEQDHLIADRTYQKLPEEDWELLYEYLYEFDSSGNQTGKIFLDYSYPSPYLRFKYVNSTVITGEGEILVSTKYNWNFDIDEWIPSSKGGSIHYENGYYNIYWYQWDRELESFIHQVEEWITWMEDVSGDKTVIHKKDKNLTNQTEIYYIREQGWNYRCDGKVILSYDSITEGIPEPEFRNRRTIYHYFDLAECDVGPPASQITVFPNPCPGILNIHSEERLGMISISITDETGRRVYMEEQELTNFTLIDLMELRPGMYYLQLGNDVLQYSGKFILSQ
jgi:hypothetical protein